MPSPEPVVCKKCGQKGNERPGFRRLPFPEAVGNDQDMMLVDSFQCNNCGTSFVVPIGSIQVRKP